MANNSIECPLCKKCTPLVNRKYDVQWLIDQYSKIQINKLPLQESCKAFYLMKCSGTGYLFFYPSELQGNVEFYSQVTKVRDYFLPWKWEYSKALKWISENDILLEIGCGNGTFIREASKKAKHCTGIDLVTSPEKREKFEIEHSDFQSFLVSHPGSFNSIVAFQVLEHIYDVNNFFRLISDSLHKNGKLLLGLPNNDSFLIKNDSELALNYPPHHMGWWTPESLKKSAELLGFKVISQSIEPLQPYHYSRYYFLKSKYWSQKYGRLGDFADKCFYPVRNPLLSVMRNMISGHTFFTVLEKK